MQRNSCGDSRPSKNKNCKLCSQKTWSCGKVHLVEFKGFSLFVFFHWFSRQHNCLEVGPRRRPFSKRSVWTLLKPPGRPNIIMKWDLNWNSRIPQGLAVVQQFWKWTHLFYALRPRHQSSGWIETTESQPPNKNWSLPKESLPENEGGQ